MIHSSPSFQWTSQRVQNMPSSIFHTIDKAKAKARQERAIIDLSIGSSDLAPPRVAIEALAAAVQDERTYGYCLHAGTQPLRQAITTWYAKRFPEAPTLDSDAHALSLIGSQEGFIHLLLATTDVGDTILLPDPYYPIYKGAIALAGLQEYSMPLQAEHNFLPRLEAIPSAVAQRAKVMVLSYPNNPTSAVADEAFFQRAIDFCLEHHILLIHDFPYLEMCFDGYRAPSILSIPRALETAVEFYSASKSFHMSGFRLGWVLGNPEALNALQKAKSVIDFNQYLGIQKAVIAALEAYDGSEDRITLKQRRDVLVSALAAEGWHIPTPKATMFAWAKLPENVIRYYERQKEATGLAPCVAFCLELIAETGVCTSPGSAFGTQGYGYLRFALVQPPEVLRAAAQAIGKKFRSLAEKGA